MKLVKLSVYAASLGLTYQTVHSWFKQGILQHETVRTPKGGILVKIPEQSSTADIVNDVADAMEKMTNKIDD